MTVGSLERRAFSPPSPRRGNGLRVPLPYPPPVLDTIAAVASPPGRAARAIVRLAGPATPDILAAVLTAAPAAPGAHAARLRLGTHTLPALLLRYTAPRSYTGQDAAELLIPGNPVLAQRVLDALLDAGARPAGPGEFTARAYLAGRLTLAQAEGVAASIAAQTETDLLAARDLLEGAADRHALAWSDEAASLLALTEAGIDFSDQEDVTPITPAELQARLRALAATLRARLAGAAFSEPTAHLPAVALVGPPNAGKSTLFNALLGRRRAAVCDEAGTTRDALVETLDPSADLPGAGPVQLIDLPGLDASPAGASSAAAQRAARDAIARADAIVLCDPAARFDEPGLPPVPTIRVRTKADLPAPTGVTPDLSVCALDGHHLPALRRAIADAAGASRRGASTAAARHERAIRRAADHLAAAAALTDPAQRALADPELLASELRAALDALGEITGAISPDDVIGRIFATFCIGK